MIVSRTVDQVRPCPAGLQPPAAVPARPARPSRGGSGPPIPRAPGACPPRSPRPAAAPPFRVADCRLERRLLPGEGMVDGTAGPPGCRRHVFQRCPRVAATGEQRRGRVQQRRPRRLRVHLPPALDILHGGSLVTYTAYVRNSLYVPGPG